MAFSAMFRRVITKTQSQHSLRLLTSRLFIRDTNISTTNKIVENGASVNSYRCYSAQTSSVGGVGVGLPSYMRGAVFWEPNKPLTMEDFRMPRPKSGEILIKTKACGVCHSDLHLMKGDFLYTRPCVVGHEITGEVVEHGPLTDIRIVKRYPIGSHVVGAFIMPCGNCFFCSKGEDELCEDFSAYNRAKGTLYDGETRLFLRSSAHALSILPDSLPYTESAILGCAVFTAYGAMAHAAVVRPGDSVAVIGVGGVGSSCLQIARAFGASDIIAVDVQDEKLQNAKAFGATHTINAIQEDAIEKIREITGGMGVDIAVEALGKPETFVQCAQSVREGGKAVMVGLTQTGAIGEVDINRLVRRKIKVIGSYGAKPRQDLPKLVRLAETGFLNISGAVSRKYKFEEACQAFHDLDQGSIVGRAVIEIS
uniref:Enoyl reductase (ER) domain-containing protein n=1 Tax=Fagus sylvatica TaxID=28930 RepID=A0A2N9IA52_FAGSY